MLERIAETLKRVADQEGVRILMAVESGSRAWGFASTDSDYDVRFIYTHPPEWYLRLEEGRDVIEHADDDELLDLNGWELRKAFRLLLKGNAAIYEWLQSPIVYAADGQFLQQMKELAPEYFPLKAGLHHYIGVTKGVLGELPAPRLKVKRLFYGLRAALAALWIVERQTLPPMEFDALKCPLEKRVELNDLVQRLRADKSVQTESFSVEPSPEMLRFLHDAIARGEASFGSLPDPKGDRGALNEYFASIILRGSS